MWHLLRESLRNNAGEVDGKLITACIAMAVMLAAITLFYLTGVQLPEFMWDTMFSLVGLGLGLESVDTVARLLRPNQKNDAPKAEEPPAEGAP